jgi:hypothetical protein
MQLAGCLRFENGSLNVILISSHFLQQLPCRFRLEALLRYQGFQLGLAFFQFIKL